MLANKTLHIGKESTFIKKPESYKTEEFKEFRETVTRESDGRLLLWILYNTADNEMDENLSLSILLSLDTESVCMTQQRLRHLKRRR